MTLFGWNSSAQFDKMFNDANTDFNFELVKPEAGFAGSDHVPFNQKRIPNTFIHTGLTSTYHTPDDDFETIDCEGAVKVIDFTEAFMDELCSSEKRPKYTYKGPFLFGVNVGTNGEGQLVISRVTNNSIASKAGLENNDIILKWSDDVLENRRDLRRVIRRDKGSTVTLKILRGDEEKTIEFLLAEPEE